MPASAELTYRAFLSYSHADARWAKWLHAALEGFRIDNDLIGRQTESEKIVGSLRPVFRDRDEFTAGRTLNGQTIVALDSSATLIVLCSPASARSQNVNEEIRLFKDRHPDRPIIPVIVAGRPRSGDAECFPPALKLKLGPQGQITDTPEPEIVAADIRHEGDGKDLGLAKVIARLLGVGTDDVFRRAERARRRRRIHQIAAASCILLLVGGIVGFSYTGLLEQSYLRIQTRKLADNYMPSALTVEQEEALKPGDSFRECASCPIMVVIPMRNSAIGSIKTSSGQEAHKTRTKAPFATGKFEVTFDEWDGCVAHGGCAYVPGDNGWGRGRQPVVNVGWDDAQIYVNWLSKQTGKEYRLLTEAEWDYAARAETTTRFSFGDAEAELDSYAWYNGNSNGQAHPVGQKGANLFGLYDIHGNVWEWVQDCYQETYTLAPPHGSSESQECNSRVVRGGSWINGSDGLASATRKGFNPDDRYLHFGFRVGRTLTH
jgi:formylglycine-generating enzyme required for sulfatase activity